MARPNPYRLLGVPRGATPEDVRSAYRRLVRRYHPDVYRGDPEVAEANTRELTEAYETLLDPERRATVDRTFSPPRARSPRASPGGAQPAHEVAAVRREPLALFDRIELTGAELMAGGALLGVMAALLIGLNLPGVLLLVPGEGASGVGWALLGLFLGSGLAVLTQATIRTAWRRLHEEGVRDARERWSRRRHRYADWTEHRWSWSETRRAEESEAHAVRLVRDPERPAGRRLTDEGFVRRRQRER